MPNYVYSLFFISYDETNADENWHRLKSRMPNAVRVHGIAGIRNAHAYCADQSLTQMFWTVDGDTVVDDTFLFDYTVLPWDSKYLHVWYSRNPVNGLEYGYGAIKLWPCSAARNSKNNWIDFTTSAGKIKIIDQVVATTAYNSDSYNAWKSGFRETIKLCLNVSAGDVRESLDRLTVWLNVSNSVQFANDTLQGARHAFDYFLIHQDDSNALQCINDFSWLRTVFDNNSNYSTLTGEIDKTQILNRITKNV